MFHSVRGAEFRDAEINTILAAFGIERSVSMPGNPYDNAVVESTNHILKRGHVADRRFGFEEELRTAPFDWDDRHDDFRIYSTLGYMSLAEFREARLIHS